MDRSASGSTRRARLPRDLRSRAAVCGLLVGFAVVAYTHVGYPLVLGLAAQRRRRRAMATPHAVDLPSLTVVIAARDEEQVIAEKLRDVLSQDYPADRLEVVVVADGSSDRTAEVAARLGARVLHAPMAAGKSAAVNRGVAVARGRLVCLTDANCALAPGALRALVEPFMRDPSVAVVSGEKVVVGGGARGAGEGLYWRLESHVKRAESEFGVVVGAPGEICGLRRAHFRPIPTHVINDDYHVSCDALARGLKVAYAPGARAVETVSASLRDEFARRTRIAAGTWQTTFAYLTLADPRRGVVAVAFVSHRVLRSIVVPALLPLLLGASAAPCRRSRVAAVLLSAQSTFYGLAVAGFFTDTRATAIPCQFLLTNVASLHGGFRHFARRQPPMWEKVQRGPWVGAEVAS